jgi:hypothetical protein
MKGRALLFVSLALLAALWEIPPSLAAEAEEPRPLAVLVADFDSSGISEGDLKEYVDYLAAALQRSLALRVEESGLYGEAEVMRVPSAEGAVTADALAAKGAEAVLVSGVLKRTDEGYALVLHVAGGRRGVRPVTLTFERYRDEEELYSGCAKLADELALACVQMQLEGSPGEAGKGPGVAEAAESGSMWAAGLAVGSGLIAQGWPLDGASCLFVLLRGYYDRGPPGVELDLSAAWNVSEETDELLLGAELYLSQGGAIALGVSFSYYLTPERADPCLGFSIGFGDVPPLFLFPLFGFGALTLRWDLASGQLITTVRFLTLSMGVSSLLFEPARES